MRPPQAYRTISLVLPPREDFARLESLALAQRYFEELDGRCGSGRPQREAIPESVRETLASERIASAAGGVPESLDCGSDLAQRLRQEVASVATTLWRDLRRGTFVRACSVQSGGTPPEYCQAVPVDRTDEVSPDEVAETNGTHSLISWSAFLSPPSLRSRHLEVPNRRCRSYLESLRDPDATLGPARASGRSATDVGSGPSDSGRGSSAR